MPRLREQQPVVPTSRQIALRLQSIDWFQFEQIVAAIYRKAGFKVERRGGANADGGIDLLMTDSSNTTIAVQCKHWKKWKVGVKEVREFIGALKIADLEKGKFVTLHEFSGEARRLAQENGIDPVNQGGLLQLFESTQARFDPEIMKMLDDPKKICPKCERKMVVRTAVKGLLPGRKFWGCSDFPRCRYIMQFSA